MANEQPVTRKERFLAGAAGEDITLDTPITREERFLAKAAGMDVKTDDPVTRSEKYLAKIAEGGGGGGSVPEYEGSYTVTPSTSAQTLETDGKKMTDDVTINAIPAGAATIPNDAHIQSTPTIIIDNSTANSGWVTVHAQVNKNNSSGKITPQVTPGYVDSGTEGDVYASGASSRTINSIGTRTYTPTTTDQTIAKNQYIGGIQTIKGDANLVAENIKSGITIFGVQGSYQGSGGVSLKSETLTSQNHVITNPSISISDFYDTSTNEFKYDSLCFCYAILDFQGIKSAYYCEIVQETGSDEYEVIFKPDDHYMIDIILSNTTLELRSMYDMYMDQDIVDDITSFTIVTIS